MVHFPRETGAQASARRAVPDEADFGRANVR